MAKEVYTISNTQKKVRRKNYFSRGNKGGSTVEAQIM